MADIRASIDDDDLPGELQAGATAESADELPGIETKTPHTRLSRKRTKTGCLTCRKRRIKCGEERPTCGNCIKSKRQCEGYTQRVIFKDPLSTYRIATAASSTNPSFVTQPVIGPPSTAQYSQFHSVAHAQNTARQRVATSTNQVLDNYSSTDSLLLRNAPDISGDAGNRQDYRILPGGNAGHRLPVSNIDHPVSAVPPHDTVELSHLPYTQALVNQQVAGELGAQCQFNDVFEYDSAPIREVRDLSHSEWLDNPPGASQQSTHDLKYQSDTHEAAAAPSIQSYQGSTNWPLHNDNASYPGFVPNLQSQPLPVFYGKQEPMGIAPGSWTESLDGNVEGVNPPLIAGFHRDGQRMVQETEGSQNWAKKEHTLSINARPERLMLHDMKDKTIRIGSSPSPDHGRDDKFFDSLDDDMTLEEYDHDPDAEFGNLLHKHLENNDLGAVVALQAYQDMHDQRLRTYHSFLDGYGFDVLSTYEPSARNSPLKDSITARIFCHFINVTGPSISLFERHPANPSLMFQGRPVPKSQQHIWAYTMPTLALNNQALLHAILAIGSLHMALLQDYPITASLKHYHIAIRQVAKSVRLPMRRGQPATLAATLLLGWYELMSADHQKWSSHLLGARQLLNEIDFAGMTSYMRTRKMQQQHTRHSNLYHHEVALGNLENYFRQQAEPVNSKPLSDVNENFVGMIMGKKLRYDQYGQILDDDGNTGHHPKQYSQRELEIYENQRDLFWWYCKMDTFQSILSGNRLFMHYDLWAQCPPRAAMGHRDATYGTYDHLILLLGRLAEFAARDLPRKKKAMQVYGPRWGPPPGAPGHSKSSESSGPPRSGPPQMPNFAGMMPGTEGKATLPRGFSPARDESPISEGNERNLDEWTKEAEEEWMEIRTAFNILEEHYGPDFQPLGPEHSPPIQSPFGPALQYRTYSIAGIWMVHYMGIILAHRYHPSMPPAATVAAGIAARQTAYFANRIGCISAAISPNAAEVSQIPTGVGAGLIESSFSLFIAGVQYQDPVQRSWVVQRLSDIKRLTGWKTANAIALGCESSWVKAAEAGRGPPYTRVIDREPERIVWYTARRRVDQVLSERRDSEKLIVAKTDRVHYALGLLGVEEDFENLAFENDNDQKDEA